MVFSGGGFHGTPPLCTNGSAGYLMQLSVNSMKRTQLTCWVGDQWSLDPTKGRICTLNNINKLWIKCSFCVYTKILLCSRANWCNIYKLVAKYEYFFFWDEHVRLFVRVCVLMGACEGMYGWYYEWGVCNPRKRCIIWIYLTFYFCLFGNSNC